MTSHMHILLYRNDATAGMHAFHIDIRDSHVSPGGAILLLGDVKRSVHETGGPNAEVPKRAAIQSGCCGLIPQ